MKAARPGRARVTVVSAVAALALILGQAFVALAGTASDPRGRDAGTTSNTTVVHKSGGSNGSAGSAISTHAAPSAPLGGSAVQLKLFGQDPTTYDHATGVGGDSSNATETELEAEKFECGDKVAYYVLLEAPGSLSGSNTISVNLNFGKHTSSSEPFGFSAGASFGLEGGGVASSDGGESTAGSGGFGSTPDDITLAFQVSDVEASEVIPVRIVLVLGNCGPGKFTGNVHAEISSCSPAEVTTCGNQSVTLKFRGTLGTIQVVKDLNPSSDPGTFNLRIAGTTFATGGDGTDTGALGFLAGTYAVDETGANGTNLGDYTSSISCQNGTQPPIVTNGTGTDVTLANGDVWVCTISNTLNPPPSPQLTIIKKVVNDDGGTAVSSDFTMQVTASNPSNNNFPGADDPGVTITLDPGDYSVGESGPSGYAATFSQYCSGTIAAGEHRTCIITNDDIPSPPSPQLTIIKKVVNDDGGTAVSSDFTMQVTASNPSNNNFPGADDPGVTITLDPGDYSVGESGPGGYAASFSADCTGTIATGEHKTCTITNDDVARPPAPELTIIKKVVNDDGGTAVSSDFTMQVTASNPSNNNFPGADDPGVTITLDPGDYSVGESGPGGYAASFSADCTGTIAAGEHKTCTITNDDVGPPPPGNPALSITKVADSPIVTAGDPIGFTITVTSTGTDTATNVHLTDPLPTGTGISWSIDGGSGAGQCSIAANTLSCSFGDMSPGASKTVHVTSPTTADSCGVLVNTASVTSSNASTVSASASITVTCPAGIVIVKGGPALAHVGDTITYTFDVSLAAGSPPLTNVTVVDPICNSAPVLQSKAGGDLDDTLETGETWNYTCTHVVTASDPDPLPNTATASGTDSNGDTVSDQDSHVVDLIHPAIDIVKTANPQHGSPGDTIVYTYKITNVGDVDLVDISVDDDVIGHICDIPLLHPGDTVTCKASFVIPADANIDVTNVVVAAGEDVLGVPVRDEDTARITVVLGVTVTPPIKTPPGGVAFTGTTAVVPLSAAALLLLLVGSGLLWAGRKRGRHAPGTSP